MDAAAHLILAMQDRPDRMASALWDWMQRHSWSTQQLSKYLGCTTPTLERLALVSRPLRGDDWHDDVEIIAISLRLQHDALRSILQEAETLAEREFGA